MTDSQQRPGLVTLRPVAEPSDAATIIVAGAPGSGTSEIVAGLRGLGVQMEDVIEGDGAGISSLIATRDVAGLRSLADQRNREHMRWGFEFSDLLESLPEAIECFQDPRVILCFRDVVSMAQREALSSDVEIEDAIGDAAKRTTVTVAVARSLRVPVLLVSYDPAMSQRDGFLATMCDFIGLPATAVIGTAAFNDPTSLVPTPPDEPGVWYDGWFEQVVGTTAHGWARRMPANSVCAIEVIAGHRSLGHGLANLLRSDLVGAGVGERGFMIPLSEPPGDDVIARVVGTDTVLRRAEAFQVVTARDAAQDASAGNVAGS